MILSFISLVAICKGQDQYIRLPKIYFDSDGLHPTSNIFYASDVPYILWKAVDSLYFRILKDEVLSKGDTTKIHFLSNVHPFECDAGSLKGTDTAHDPNFWDMGRNNGKMAGHTVPHKPDTSRPSSLPNMVFLIQQNMDLSQRLDRLQERIDSLERRPYLLIDLKCSRPGVWLTNAAGEYQIFITPINYK